MSHVYGELVIADEIKSFSEMRNAAREGMRQPQADLEQITESTPPAEETGSLPPETGEKATEGNPQGEPEVKTSPTQGSSEGTKDYWEQYPDEAARRKALNETKTYAAETARKAKELEAEVAELRKSRTEATPVSKDDAKAEEPTPDNVSVDEYITQTLNLKEGHTDDQLRLAQINWEVLKFQKEVFTPALEASKTTKAALEKATDAVRDQKAHVSKLRTKAESNSLYADDLKEAIGELRDLEKAHTDADLAFDRAERKLEKVSRDEERKRLEGRAFATQSVEKLRQKSRETKAQTERVAQEAKAKEDSDKAWQTEFEKALKTNGLDSVSDKAKKALHAAAYTHVYELSKAGQVTDETDLQVLLKESFQPYLELKASAPALESAVERKKDVTDEPGPANRKAKTGEEQPKTLADYRAAAKRGMRSSR